MEVFDLHSHTLHSDGAHTVAEVVGLAKANGVNVLSITDHDTLEAYHKTEALKQHDKACLTIQGVTLLPGIEFSTYWNKVGIHVVGLNVDLQSGFLEDAVSKQQVSRAARAEKIAEKLEQQGIECSLQGVKSLAGKEAGVSRVHFADYLVQTGYVKNREQAFKRFLGSGKPGDVKYLWADLAQVVEWIRCAGGVAVLAHPLRYRLTRTKLARLIDYFIAVGGEAIEVLSGRQDKDATTTLVQLAEEKKLHSSLGSDFHSSAHAWIKLGMHPRLPNACRPVWDLF